MVLEKQNKESIVEKAIPIIPLGRNKSGREWKKLQHNRASSQNRAGVLEHLRKTFEEKQKIREKKLHIKTIEEKMKEDKKLAIEEDKRIRDERIQRRLANEQKSTSFQSV
jgi:ribosomal protein L20A (L18A)